MPRKLSSLLLVLVLLGAGLYAAAWRGVGLLREAADVASWPTMIGEVVSSHSERREGGSSPSDLAVVVVTYCYRVDGTLHTGNRWTVVGPRQARGATEAEALRTSYSSGDPIEVRYGPDDPSRAVLAEGGTGKGWAHIGFGLLLVGVGGYLGRKRLTRG